MASRNRDAYLRPSVLDRLLDTPGSRWDPGGGKDSLSQSVGALQDALLRDLEWLLNTRRIAFPAGEDFPEVQRSLYHYGLRDISSLSSDSSEVRSTLSREVEDLLRLFEPRLTGVRVTVPEASKERRREVRFVIEGMLNVDPEPVPVTFDTVLEVASGEFNVEER